MMLYKQERININNGPYRSIELLQNKLTLLGRIIYHIRNSIELLQNKLTLLGRIIYHIRNLFTKKDISEQEIKEKPRYKDIRVSFLDKYLTEELIEKYSLYNLLDKLKGYEKEVEVVINKNILLEREIKECEEYIKDKDKTKEVLNALLMIDFMTKECKRDDYIENIFLYARRWKECNFSDDYIIEITSNENFVKEVGEISRYDEGRSLLGWEYNDNTYFGLIERYSSNYYIIPDKKKDLERGRRKKEEIFNHMQNIFEAVTNIAKIFIW